MPNPKNESHVNGAADGVSCLSSSASTCARDEKVYGSALTAEAVEDFLSLSDQGFFETDADGNIQHATPAVGRFLTLDTDAILNQSLDDILRRIAVDPKRVCHKVRKLLGGGNPIELEISQDRRCPVILKIAAKPMFSPDKQCLGYRGAISDISELRVLTRTLVDQAHSDMLTGIGNRRGFNAWVQASVERSLKTLSPTIIAVVDLNRFKQVNDSLGHAAGDSVLIQTVRRIETFLGPTDKIARLNGDEFGILFGSASIDSVQRTCQDIATGLSERPFNWQGREVKLTISVGIAASIGQLIETSSILHRAVQACSQSKSDSEAVITIAPMQDDGVSQIDDFLSVREIEAAISSHRLHIVTMPIARILRTGHRVNHHEVLVRLRDSAGQLHAPGRLIASAERLGVMPMVDKWIINQTLEQMTDAGGIIGINLNINLSGQSLSDADFSKWLLKRVDDADLWPGQFCFEITETTAVRNMQTAFDLLSGLRERGCRVALDDFGSGLASFAYLMKFEADYLKIDGSIITDVANDPTQRACVSAIVGLAKAVRAETVAEFVETEETLDILRSIGVDYVQGHLIGKPVDLDDVTADAPLALLATKSIETA